MHPDILRYHQSLSAQDRDTCDELHALIAQGLPTAESKVWHGHPVWFLNGNPIVGYAKLKRGVQLLFWSGQSFDEPLLKPEGSFKAAQALYTAPQEIVDTDVMRWLKKAQTIQWDYGNIVKNRGVLNRIDTNV